MKKSEKSLKGSIFSKVTILFITALLLVVCSLVAFNLVYFRNATQELSSHIRSQSHRSLELSVNEKLNDYAGYMYRIVTDNAVRDYLSPKSYQLQNSSLILSHMNKSLVNYTNGSNEILGISVIRPNQDIYVYDRTAIHIQNNLWREDLSTGQLQNLGARAAREKEVFFIADSRHPNRLSMIHVVLSVWDYFTMEDMGFVVMTLDAKTLWELIGSSAAEQTVFDYLMLPEGTMLVHPDYQNVGAMVEGYQLNTDTLTLSPQNGTLPENPIIPPNSEISINKMGHFDVYLISVLAPGAYNSLVRRYAFLTTSIVLLIALLFTGIYLLVLRGMTRSIHAVVQGIQQVEKGDLNVHINIPPRDEIYDIAQAFNRSLENLKQISEERDQEFSRFLQEAERRCEAEVHSLQSQINSHFLYNTLSVINYTALEGDSRKTTKMIQSLAESLRYTLDNPWEKVTVRDEMVWLKQYLLLQNERQPSLFCYTINAKEDVLEVPTYKLIIQPFVENAIQHGFAGCKTTRSLDIAFRLLPDKKRMAISIYDNGLGIPKEKLNRIQNLLNNYTKTDGLGIGIKNAAYRLKIHYGNTARVFVRSYTGGGTKFNIVLPVTPPNQPMIHTEKTA